MYGQRQQHQQQLEAASYPLMQVAEICDCLSALNIPVQQEDIMKPHAASAQHIYSSLVAEIMGAPMDMIEQPKGALMGMMEYREVYSDALSFTLFFRHARTLAETCGIRNFTIPDLTRPDGGRLRHHLSGIMNFAKYRDEKSALQQQLQEQNRRASERMSKLQKQLEEVEHNISIITEKNAADKPRTEEARQRNERLRDELLELRNSQMRLSHDVEELKKDRVGLNETAAGQTNTLNQLDVNINSARSRLVQSPERIKKHISEMSYNVSTEKATLANNQRKGRDFTNRLEIIGQLETDIKGLIDLSKGIEQQRAKVEDAKRALLALRAKLENKDIDSKTLITRTDQLQRQIQNALDRHARSEANVQETREKHRNRMEELSAEYKSLSTKRTIVSKEREKLEAEQRELEGEMEAFVKTHEEELNSLLEEYWILRGQAEDYFGTMYRTLGLDKYQ